MTASTTAESCWPVAAATHAARDAIGTAPAGSVMWPGLIRFMEWAAAAGFDGIELSDTVIPFDQDECGDLGPVRRAAEEHGLRLPALNLLRCSLADPDHAAANVERVRRSIACCADLGGDVVSISLAIPRAVDDCNRYRGLDHARGSSRDASDADFAGTAEHLRALADEAGQSGVRLSIEVHHASVADNAGAVLRLLKAADRSAIGANPDLINGYWAYCEPEEDWQAQLAALAPLTNLWHVKNVQRVEVEPGKRAQYLGTSLADGDIDYRLACKMMRDAGYRGWVSIERGGIGDALHTMGTSLTYLHQLMQS